MYWVVVVVASPSFSPSELKLLHVSFALTSISVRMVKKMMAMLLSIVVVEGYPSLAIFVLLTVGEWLSRAAL